MSSKTKRLTEMALLTATALIIFVVESYIPIPFPIPGIKPGFANIITVYAVYRYSPRETAMIVLTRVILSAVFCGNMSVLLYSISGAVLCLAGMILLRGVIPEKYIFLSSIVGALLHNTGQLIAAAVIMRTATVLAYAPFLAVSGCLAGAFTGLCAQLILKKTKRI